VTDLRCDNLILFGVVDNDVLEVKCRSSRCGAGKGVVVLHRFDISTGKLLSTNRYKNPMRRNANEQSLGNSAAVRPA
jgi:hypothetical protein